jgi:A/G-specific adenine glycosylase
MFMDEYHTKKRSEIGKIRAAVLAWYDAERRVLPWRAAPGTANDPYAVWLSEIMLQQTTVATVKGYFEAFMAQWPKVSDLAAAKLDEVLVAWQGLGYYARARNLHKCARVVADEYNGEFPGTVDDLLKLPGIGPYTASAVGAIAFDQSTVPVDGNIERVVSRLCNIQSPLPGAKSEIQSSASLFADKNRPGDFAQALMDLGATICTPKSPKCMLCPVQKYCDGRKQGDPSILPVKAPKKVRPERRAVVFWLENQEGAVLLRRRPESGLLGGMMEFPSTDWREGDLPTTEERDAAEPVSVKWASLPDEAVHVFTHFKFRMQVFVGKTDRIENVEGIWVRPEEFSGHALPTVMKKVIRHVKDYRELSASSLAEN